jgi:hypothetical protein
MARYGATALSPLRKVRDVPASRTISGQGAFTGAFDAVMGRESLDPIPETEMLAAFADGSPALTRHTQGRGKVYVAAFFAGDEYGADVMQPSYDLSKDLSRVKRAFVAMPALMAGVEPVVDCVDAPLVEGLLVKSASSGKRAISLMNWAYRTVAQTGGPDSPKSELVPAEHLVVRVRGAGDVRRVVSSWTGRELTSSRDGNRLVITVPKLEEADVLLLE